MTADSDEDLVCFDGLSVAEFNAHRVGGSAFDATDARVQVQPRSEIFERGADQLAGERFLLRQQGAAGDEVDPRSKPCIRGREFDADDSAAEDGEAFRHVLHAGRVAARPWPALPEAGEVGKRGDRTGAHGYRVSGRELRHRAVGRRDGDLARRGQNRVTAHQVDAGAREPFDPTVVGPVARHPVATSEHGSDVELSGDRLARSSHFARGPQERTAAQQCLRRHAGPVGALAPDELRLHDDSVHSALGGPVGDVLTDRAGSDHDHVVLGCVHGCSFTVSMSRCRCHGVDVALWSATVRLGGSARPHGQRPTNWASVRRRNASMPMRASSVVASRARAG